MAKKRAPKVQATTQYKRTGQAVRLDLQPEDFERLERQAKKRGLPKASYARMAVLERLDADEEGGAK